MTILFDRVGNTAAILDTYLLFIVSTKHKNDYCNVAFVLMSPRLKNEWQQSKVERTSNTL